jgi:hypothetical protein
MAGASIVEGFTHQTVTYEPPGEIDPFTGDRQPGEAVEIKARYVNRQQRFVDRHGQEVRSQATAMVGPRVPLAVDGRIEGRLIERVKEIRDMEGQVLGFKAHLT